MPEPSGTGRALATIFIGTGDIGIPALEAIAAHPSLDLVAVVTGEDKPVGRKQVLTPPRVRTRAEELGVALILQPARLRSIRESLEALAPDLIVVMAYGHLLPGWLLDLPTEACLNLHASLLPRHRGASPIQAAIREGDRESGITVMHVAPELDAGDIVLSLGLDLAADETGGSLHDRLAPLAARALEAAVARILAGTAPRRAQDAGLATYARKLTREDGVIDWTLPADRLERLIRAYDPWPGTHSLLLPSGDPAERPLRIKVFPPTSASAHAAGGGSHPPGTVVRADHAGIVVAAGEGTLTLHQIQPDGKRRMDAADFLAGHALAAGVARFDPSGPDARG